MPIISSIYMMIWWLMAVTLFALVVMVLIELIKFLKLKNAALRMKVTKTYEETSPKQDSL